MNRKRPIGENDMR